MAQKLKATFFAFSRERRAPGMGGVTLLHLLVLSALWAGFFALSWADILQHGFTPTGTDPFRFWLNLAPCFALNTVVFASYEAACLRWMLRREAGLFHLGSVWRVLLGRVCWLVIAALFLVVVVACAVSLMMVSEQGRQPYGVAPLLQFAPLVFLLLVTLIGVRLSPGNAVSVVREQFAYLDGWIVSRDRFFALLGSVVVLGLLSIAAFYVLIFVFTIIVTIISGGPQADPARFSGLVGVVMCSAAVIAGMISTFLTSGVNARATLVAIDEGKLKGVTSNLVHAFD